MKLTIPQLANLLSARPPGAGRIGDERTAREFTAQALNEEKTWLSH